MTTTVTVSARCADNIEVKVVVNDEDDNLLEEHTLQDGEEKDVYTYDDRVIMVREVEK